MQLHSSNNENLEESVLRIVAFTGGKSEAEEMSAEIRDGVIWVTKLVLAVFRAVVNLSAFNALIRFSTATRFRRFSEFFSNVH